MNARILPTVTTGTNDIFSSILNNSLSMRTSLGLVKNLNEDRVGYIVNSKFIRLLVVDGHWGEEAAQKAAEFWLNGDMQFPTSRSEAIQKTSFLERDLFKAFGKKKMDEEKDFTPEAAFTVIQIEGKQLRLVSYGDCRAFVVRGGEIAFDTPVHSTWLGAFSHLNLRNRLKIQETLEYHEVGLELEDYICLMTDGITECVYGRPTISLQQLTKTIVNTSPIEATDTIMTKVFDEGAEDNASILIYKVAI